MTEQLEELQSAVSMDKVRKDIMIPATDDAVPLYQQSNSSSRMQQNKATA